MDVFILCAFAIFATLVMLYDTDGDPERIAVFMLGVLVAGTGSFLAMYLAKRKMKDGRKQER